MPCSCVPHTSPASEPSPSRQREEPNGPLETLAVIAPRQAAGTLRPMSLTLAFVTGDVTRIREAIVTEHPEALDEPAVVQNSADFSLHIQPSDLDLLSLAMHHHGDADAPLRLRPHLEVLVDEPDRGLLAVSADWVRYVAAVDPADAPELTRDWFGAMAREHGAGVADPSDDAVESVAALVDLCRAAIGAGADVYHWWLGPL